MEGIQDPSRFSEYERNIDIVLGRGRGMSSSSTDIHSHRSASGGSKRSRQGISCAAYAAASHARRAALRRALTQLLLLALSSRVVGSGGGLPLSAR